MTPREDWFCRCWNYLRHRVLRPATLDRCEQCGARNPAVAPTEAKP